MTTATTNKGYLKPVVGGDSGSWGTELNTLFDEVDYNVGGYLAKSVAGSADVTLTTGNGSESSNFFLKLTGAITANINVIFPSKGGFWLVQNATSGSFTLTAKTAAGTGYAVPQTSSLYTLIFSDGTNIYALKSIGGVLITGTVGSTLNIGAGGSLYQSGTGITGSSSAQTVVALGSALGMYAIHSYANTGGNNWAALVFARNGGTASIAWQSSTTYSISGSNVQLTAGAGTGTVDTFYSQLTIGT